MVTVVAHPQGILRQGGRLACETRCRRRPVRVKHRRRGSSSQPPVLRLQDAFLSTKRPNSITAACAGRGVAASIFLCFLCHRTWPACPPSSTGAPLPFKFSQLEVTLQPIPKNSTPSYDSVAGNVIHSVVCGVDSPWCRPCGSRD